jgi:hypothetical protein
MYNITPQLNWLQKLASGAIGFQSLDVLRFNFAKLRESRDLQAFIHQLEVVGPLTFRRKRVEILVEGHCCVGAGCPVAAENCSFHAQLAALLLVKPMASDQGRQAPRRSPSLNRPRLGRASLAADCIEGRVQLRTNGDDLLGVYYKFMTVLNIHFPCAS